MKLNAYKGYVVPVIAYASQAWSANKGEMNDIEKKNPKTGHLMDTWRKGKIQQKNKTTRTPASIYVLRNTRCPTLTIHNARKL